MRLWHKDLIPVLPRQQLLSQWRECCCIARNIKVNGTPNHILVNLIMTYPKTHFTNYAQLVAAEMKKRGYRCQELNFSKYYPETYGNHEYYELIFEGWHNQRYLKQCYYNLQEKYDRGGIPEEEWLKIQDFMCSNPEVIKYSLTGKE